MGYAIQFDPIRLPPAAEALRAEVRAFIEEAEADGHLDVTSRGGFDREFSRKVAQRGWIGMTWPKAYGGGERSFLERYVVTEEFLVARAPTRSPTPSSWPPAAPASPCRRPRTCLQTPSPRASPLRSK